MTIDLEVEISHNAGILAPRRRAAGQPGSRAAGHAAGQPGSPSGPGPSKIDGYTPGRLNQSWPSKIDGRRQAVLLNMKKLQTRL